MRTRSHAPSRPESPQWSPKWVGRPKVTTLERELTLTCPEFLIRLKKYIALSPFLRQGSRQLNPQAQFNPKRCSPQYRLFLTPAHKNNEPDADIPFQPCWLLPDPRERSREPAPKPPGMCRVLASGNGHPAVT
ncbi:hypothetical protein H8959_007542 [Pygathrix nigripes]